MGGGHVVLVMVLRGRLVSFSRSIVVLGSFVVFVFGHKMYSPAELDRRGQSVTMQEQFICQTDFCETGPIAARIQKTSRSYLFG
jgi:hypothetical protein